MPSNSPIIRFKDVYKYYHAGDKKVTALSGVSLEFQQGDFVSIMGPSGGGKTTFLNCLGGLDLPDRGEIYLENRLLNNMNDKELIELKNKPNLLASQFSKFLIIHIV
jgi:putative ABC transport system ATP-binding protein